MNALQFRIKLEGKNLGRGILKVDAFINHQVDPQLMHSCAIEFASRFLSARPTKVLTAEISGIAPALLTGLELQVPIVYARKTKPITMPDTVILTTAPSHTKGVMVDLMVSPEYLGKGERVLIIDDFLASGQTIMGLVRLAQAAGAEVIGIGALIEKTFEGGREMLEQAGLRVESLVRITAMTDDQIVFAD
ncbi:MAG TPA: xanthine phosphoribosyltransferase [Anaerolineae bacterium]|nr:xanthine phosphoribosyltransferase [Anaerolineae bacterium]